MNFYVYLLTSQKNGTLYCGHTDDIGLRVWQHKQGKGAQFTRKYGVKRLVWYELHDTPRGRQNTRIPDQEMEARLENQID